jgi:nucleotide-binding universal stress UspA family protein
MSMSSIVSRRTVVVGVDGSEQAMAAAEWALRYARARQLRLEVVSGVDWPVHAQPFSPYMITPVPQVVGEDTQRIVEDVAERCRQIAPDVEVIATIAQEPPIPALLAAADASELLVVGCRGLRPTVAAVLGSVSTAVVAHATCPVVVVRSVRQAGPEARVVVGIDGSDRDDITLQYAFDEASRSGAPLVIFHAWSDVALVTALGIAIGEVGTWVQLRAEAEGLVARRLNDWAPKYPDVAVHTRVVRDRPVHTLLELGHTAGLLVVGSHGRGGFLGMMLGSVARQLVHHADCPVMVVRRPATPAEHADHNARRAAREAARAIEGEES